MVCLPLFFTNEHHIFVAVTHRNQSLFLPWAGDILIANLPRSAIDSCHKVGTHLRIARKYTCT